MAPAMAGVDTAPHQVALTLIAFFIAIIRIVVIAAVIVGPDADPETTAAEAAMESTSVEASSKATTVATSKATHVTAPKATHVATASAAKAAAVASTTAAAAVARQGDIRAEQANRGQRQQSYHRFTKHHSLS
jgi:hypothetical protein